MTMRMKTKVVYVLVCSGKDTYFEQFLLSLLSLKYHDPEREVEVFMDPDSYGYVRKTGNALLREGVTLQKAEVPNSGSGLFKSRYLKTTLRQRVEGDFLFLDTDTLVAGALDEVDRTAGDVAAAASINGPARGLTPFKRRLLSQAGFPESPDGAYFNSGVLLVRDTPLAAQLFECWHALWQVSFERNVPYDQPALYAANLRCGGIIRELPGKWNCLVTHDAGLHYFREALVIHWDSKNEGFKRKVLIPHVKETGGHPDAFARSVAMHPRAMGLGLFRPHRRTLVLEKGFSHLLFILKKYPGAFFSVLGLKERISRRIH